MTKYNWSDELCLQVIQFVNSARYSHDFVHGANLLLAKLDSRPNFRATEHECCMFCIHAKCRREHVQKINYSYQVCDNFTWEAEEPDGSSCDLGECYFGEVACSSRNTNSICDHRREP